MKKTKSIIFALILIVSPFCNLNIVIASTSAPVIFFSDMTDGVTSGFNGSSTRGAAITIWGNNFGNSRGSSYITVGGVNLTNDSDYAEWGATTNPQTARGLQRITFFLNSSMNISGSAPNSTIQVNVNGINSNTIPFHCRANGNIYFLSTTGSDSNNGKSTNAPWATFAKVRTTMQAGDIVYVRAGTYTGRSESYYGPYYAMMSIYCGDNLGMGCSFNNGTAYNSIAIAAYPGEAPVLGNGLDHTNNGTNDNPENFISVFQDISGTTKPWNYWTFSKLSFVLYNKVHEPAGSAMDMTGIRWVGTDVRITQGSMGSGFAFNIYGSLTHFYLYGNYMHDGGWPPGGGNPTWGTYSVYFGGGLGGKTTSDDVQFAWNEIYNSSGRGFDVYGHSSGDIIQNIYIHDNYIHKIGVVGVDNSSGTGLVLGGGDNQADGSYTIVGSAYVYNNIITDCIGQAMRLSGTGGGTVGGTWYVYNNTLYNNAGPEATGDFWITNAYATFVKNNIDLLGSGAAGWTTNYGSDNYGNGVGGAGGGVWDYNFLDMIGATHSWDTTGNVDNSNYSGTNDKLNADPKFIGASYSSATSSTTYSDFALQSDSPAKGAGTNLPGYTTDFYGNTRSNPPSMGAIEYTNASSDTTPPAAPSGLSVY